ncbi:MAG: hypothetical protein R3Y61_04060 [Rikenellaceae bacterium]
MKTIKLSLLAFAAILFASCVDNSYNLDDLDDDNTGLGDSSTEVSAPLGTVEIPFENIIEGYSRAAQQYTLIDQTVEDEFLLEDGWLSESIVNSLTDSDGTITITASCDNYPEGLPEITFEIWFDSVVFFDGVQVISSENPSITSGELTAQEVKDIAASTTLKYKAYFSEKTFTADLDDVESLVIKLSITKTGAIKF